MYTIYLLIILSISNGPDSIKLNVYGQFVHLEECQEEKKISKAIDVNGDFRFFCEPFVVNGV